MTREELKEKVRAELKTKKITIKQFAKNAGVDSSTMYRWLQDKHDIGASTCEKIMVALNVNEKLDIVNKREEKLLNQSLEQILFNDEEIVYLAKKLIIKLLQNELEKIEKGL